MRFEGIRINELKPQENINGIYVLKTAEVKTGSNKKQYLDIVFMDATGEITAKQWDLQDVDPAALSLHKLYYVNARVDQWKEILQLNVNRMRLADAEDQKEIGQFVPAAPLPPDEMLGELYAFVGRIRHSEIRSVVLRLLDEREGKLVYYPAAKSFHHSFRSGLLYHMIRMLRSAEALAGVYPGVDTDLLFAGVLLHDLAKMDEMEANELGIADYTFEGKLLGHISIGMNAIDRVGRELGASNEVIVLLQHMVLSHHYEPEYGSPKKPLFLEAELLHYLDVIDARVYDFENALRNVKPGNYSEPVFSLDRRVIYKPAIHADASGKTEASEEAET